MAKQSTISVTCPKCGHVQPEPRGVYSTICKKCRTHIRLEETPEAVPVAKKQKDQAPIEKKQVICFQCGTELEVSAAAESTMCKRCSSHVDLRDYQITATVSKNFRTHGRMVLEEKGYIMNTDSEVGDGVLKGRFIGKIRAVRTLEIYSSATIKGTFTTGCLIIPAGNHFRCPERLQLGGAEIFGELAANISSTGTVRLKATARMFGDIQAKNLVIESGAVFVGEARIGGAPESAPAEKSVAPTPTAAAREAKPKATSSTRTARTSRITKKTITESPAAASGAE